MTGIELILGLILGVAAVVVEYTPKILAWYKARGTQAVGTKADSTKADSTKADGPAAE